MTEGARLARRQRPLRAQPKNAQTRSCFCLARDGDAPIGCQRSKSCSDPEAAPISAALPEMAVWPPSCKRLAMGICISGSSIGRMPAWASAQLTSAGRRGRACWLGSAPLDVAGRRGPVKTNRGGATCPQRTTSPPSRRSTKRSAPATLRRSSTRSPTMSTGRSMLSRSRRGTDSETARTASGVSSPTSPARPRSRTSLLEGMGASDNEVFAFPRFAVRMKATSREASFHLHHYFRFGDDGKIEFYRGSEDSAQVAQALAG